MSPPTNHESGTISDVLTADDGGYRMRGYIVTWRGSRVFVAGQAADPRPVGASLDFTVFRSSVHGQRGLRFAVSQAGDDTSVAEDESRNAHVSITAGTSKVEDVLAVDNEGYSFVAYLVSWHDKRVAVVDPSLHPPKAVGDQIDFKVLSYRCKRKPPAILCIGATDDGDQTGCRPGAYNNGRSRRTGRLGLPR